MRVAIAQVNVTVGDLDGNVAKLREVAARAKAQGADLVVFPELAVPGYPPQDLLFEPAFVEANRRKVEKLAKELADGPPVVVVGFAEPTSTLRPHNAAAVLAGGRVAHVVRKALLPTYDVFDEARYFTPNPKPTPTSIPGIAQPVGLHICEDMWDDDYPVKPCRELAAGGAKFLLNVSASPFNVGKPAHRIEVARRRVKETGLPMVYVNLVGAQDELVFDGHSFVLDAKGRLVALAKGFEEDLLVVEVPTDTSRPEVPMPDVPREEAIHRALVLGVRDYFGKQRIPLAVIGLSGGIDSAVVATLAADALGPERVIGVSMPSKHSTGHSVDDARVLAQNLGIEYHVIPIQESVDVATRRFQAAFGEYRHRTTVENLQARERGKILMEIANDRGGIVLSTGNKTELALGYCTLYGDMCGGLSVIADLGKRDVYALARHVNKKAGRERIPEGSITKVPSAELSDNQFDPFDYEVVSPLVDDLVENHADRDLLIEKGYPPNVVDDCLRRYNGAEFKRRQAPIGLKVTGRAFGMGRRLPIVQRWSRQRTHND